MKRTLTVTISGHYDNESYYETIALPLRMLDDDPILKGAMVASAVLALELTLDKLAEAIKRKGEPNGGKKHDRS
ncbi:hypothetical protein LCGC14_0613940 [marine sediment metagenome]|uniref:Uncharacterized protein n=1 Tax=marine sediment metagenome TaxID=412755 RepID=A0A0F9RBN8_9ZZZZ